MNPIVPDVDNTDTRPAFQLTMVVQGGQPRLYLAVAVPPRVLAGFMHQPTQKEGVGLLLRDIRDLTWDFIETTRPTYYEQGGR